MFVRIFSVLFVCLFLLSTANEILAQAPAYPAAGGFNVAGSDARAIEVVHESMAAMGGWDNWRNTRYVVWTLSGQNHVWDKWTGRFRIERDNTIVSMNVHDKSGRVWTNGQEVTGVERDDILETTYGRWVNNSYWLMMPYKLKDSGVTLKYMGTGKTEKGRDADMLELTFEGTGLTPQNRYLIAFDAETRLVSQWSFYRKATDTKPEFVLPWTDWQTYGKVKIAAGRGETKITNLRTAKVLPDAVFESTASTGLFD
jgi:hypothetical protein